VRLAQDGFDVGITYNTDEEGAQGTAQEVRELGRRAEVRHLDLGRPRRAGRWSASWPTRSAASTCSSTTRARATRPWDEITVADFRDTIEVNLIGAFSCAQEAARRMRAAGTPGRIVNVTSVHEHIPNESAGGVLLLQGRARAAHAVPRARAGQARDPRQLRRARARSPRP
jgi:NAD(P)-dependent dehydrogenase (short-subunit alcohol dehydrogenase family)